MTTRAVSRTTDTRTETRWQPWEITRALRTLRIVPYRIRLALQDGQDVRRVLRHLAVPRLRATHPDYFRGRWSSPGSVSHAQYFKSACQAYHRLRRLSGTDWHRWVVSTTTVPDNELPWAWSWDRERRHPRLSAGWQESREHVLWQGGR